MNAEQQLEQSMQEEQIREALNAHWHASAAGDANAEHSEYYGVPQRKGRARDPVFRGSLRGAGLAEPVGSAYCVSVFADERTPSTIWQMFTVNWLVELSSFLCV